MARETRKLEFYFTTWEIFPENELKERGIHLLMVEFCSIPLQCVCSSGVGGLVGRYCSGMLVGILCYAAIKYLWVEIIDMTFTELIQFLNLGIYYNDVTLYV